MKLPEPLPLPPGYQLRNWAAQDLGDITELDALIFGPDAWSQELFESEYQASTATNPHSVYRVLTFEDRIIGFAGLLYGPPFDDITTIGVHPDHTGKKLGAALLI